MARLGCVTSLLGLALLGCLSLAASAALAQAPEESPDVRVVVDVSGSMKRNDPDQLAASAMELLVSVLPSGARAGVWTFGETITNPLALGEVSEQWRNRALALPPALRDYQQYTDIETALEQAADARANGWRHLILMTDGVIDLPPARGDKPAIDEASRQRLVEETAQRFANNGVVVHAIAFSDEADLALVEQLAQRTGGLAAVAESPERLLGAFLDIIERIFPADQVPLEDRQRFVIDDSVENFSALIFHEPDSGSVTLIAPDGTRYTAETAPDDVRWQVEPRFDLIRVPEPMAGEWRLATPAGAKSRISVNSPWQLHTTALPTTLYRGFPVSLEAWLSHDDPDMPRPAGLGISVVLEDDDGQPLVSTALDAAGDDERFVGQLPAPLQVGNARWVVRARAEGFERQREQAANILPAIGMVHEPQRDALMFAAEHPRLNRTNTRIHGELLGQRLDAEPVADTRWRMALPEVEDDVRRTLRLSAEVTLDGETRELDLPDVALNADSVVGIDSLDMAGPTLSAETFASSEEAPADMPPPNWADRVVDWINAAPATLDSLWQGGWPEVRRLATTHGRDPRWWAGVIALLLIWLAWRGWRRRQQASSTTRKEPHV